MSEKIDELAKGLSKFNLSVGAIPKNIPVKVPTKSGREYTYKYADLATIWDVIRKPLAEAGLCVVQTFSEGNLVTTLIHESGQHISSTMGLGVSPSVDHKSLGGAITYMRRYTLVSILSLAADEDDGEAPENETQLNPVPVAPKTLSPSQIKVLDGLIGDDMEFLNKILSVNRKNYLKDIAADQFDIIMEAARSR